MKKYLIILLILLVGCEKQKIKLDENYYNQGNYIEIKSDYLEKNNPNNYILYVYNSFCSLEIPCETIFKKYMEKYKIDFLSINIDEYKKTNLYEKVKYAPTIIIIKNKKIYAYLDAESDEDIIKYQDEQEFEKWINKYIETK